LLTTWAIRGTLQYAKYDHSLSLYRYMTWGGIWNWNSLIERLLPGLGSCCRWNCN